MTDDSLPILWTAPPPTVWPLPLCAPATRCQFPMWDGPTPRPPIYCGEPADRFSLCAAHRARCYYPFVRKVAPSQTADGTRAETSCAA